MTSAHYEAEELRTREARINSWSAAYEADLAEAVASPHVRLDQLIEICWQKGLLDHVSPADLEVRAIRADLGRTLWPSRNDWRSSLLLQYSMEGIRAGLQYTVIGEPNTTSVIKLITYVGRLPLATLRQWFPKLKRHAAWPWAERLVELLIERAQKEVRAHAGIPHEPTLRQGAIGIFREIDCEIDRVLVDGRLWLTGRDHQSRMKLLEVIQQLQTNGRVCPSLVDPSKFQNPKGKR